jgi:non-ribosomal peptide synthetase component F
VVDKGVDESRQPTESQAIDFTALSKITTLSDSAALEKAGALLAAPEGYRTAATVGHTSLDQSDAKGNPLRSTNLDTTVTYQLSLAGLPVVGPGAKLPASFAADGSVPQLTPADRIGQISSVSFDAFHFELWNTLAAGAELVVLPAVTDLIAADFQRQMRRFAITAMLVPTMVVNHVVREDRDAFSALRLLQVGGDVLLPWACRDLLSGRFEGELYNLYGPSEITTACMSSSPASWIAIAPSGSWQPPPSASTNARSAASAAPAAGSCRRCTACRVVTSSLRV